jgi:ABC-type nitrate/sulfonate/bicarbonate transport system substrate-binding protein
MRNLTRLNLKSQLAVALVFAAVLCGAGAQAADTVKVHMPPPSLEAMPYLIANDLGFYKDDGIDFQGQILNTDIGVMATVAGSVDATQILGLSLRGAIEQGFDLKIVMLFNRLPTYSLYAAKGTTSYQDLKGKKIASTSSGASATKALKEKLAANGVDPQRDVTIFYIGATPTIFQALTAGTVDGGVLLSPFDISAKEQGFVELSLADKPGIITGGVSMSGKFLRERPDVARRFLHATWRGLRFFKSNRDGAVTAMTKAMKIEPKLAGQIYDKWIDRFSANGLEDDSYIEQVLNFEFGKVSEEQSKRAFDFSLVRSFTGK